MMSFLTTRHRKRLLHRGVHPISLESTKIAEEPKRVRKNVMIPIMQAQQLYAQMGLERIEEIGRTAGFTSKRPPRNYRGIYAERDGDDARLHGEALRRFIRGWREIGGDRRRIKGV